jgi:hypothetical protein
MVSDELWASVASEEKTLLCDTCFRKRLGRPLLIKDLTNCPFNWGWRDPMAADDDPVGQYDIERCYWTVLYRRRKTKGSSG